MSGATAEAKQDPAAEVAAEKKENLDDLGAASAIVGVRTFLDQLVGMYDTGRASKAAGPVVVDLTAGEVRDAAAQAKGLFGWVNRTVGELSTRKQALDNLTDAYARLSSQRWSALEDLDRANAQVGRLEKLGDNLHRALVRSGDTNANLRRELQQTRAMVDTQTESLKNLHWLVGSLREGVDKLFSLQRQVDALTLDNECDCDQCCGFGPDDVQP